MNRKGKIELTEVFAREKVMDLDGAQVPCDMSKKIACINGYYFIFLMVRKAVLKCDLLNEEDDTCVRRMKKTEIITSDKILLSAFS